MNVNLPPPPLPPPIVPNVHTVQLRAIDARAELEHLINLQTAGCLEMVIYKCFNPIINPILQEGPTCGLVALSMALKGEALPETLLAIAKRKCYSTSGEIFSCEWMKELADGSAGRQMTTSIIEGGLIKHINCITNCLTHGGCLVVPYDKSQDHSPCLAKGHSAHWAVITGIVIVATKQESELCLTNIVTCDCVGGEKNRALGYPLNGNISAYCLGANNDQLILTLASGDGVEPVDIYFPAYQGLSRHVKLWSLPSLAASNSNLEEISTKWENMRLPVGGIKVGLCNKAILLMPRESS